MNILYAGLTVLFLFNPFEVMKQFFKLLLVVVALLFWQPRDSQIAVSETMVYIVSTGKVYHATKTCKGLSNATHPIQAIPLSQAQKIRRACKICYK
ncbi:MAG: hypothetical protein J6Y99_08840 [Bacteroidales bacterium]|nr:hypothetical protein [Bacteroidales bacterium]